MTILAVILAFSILIIIHELGHFIVAKRNGVKVEIFSIGFGPKLFSVKSGDTEYKVSLIPLGGYVKMAGIVDESMDQAGVKGQPWEFLSKTLWQRFKIIAAGPWMNFVLAWAIFIGVFMMGIPYLSTKVGEIKEGYPAAAAGLKSGDEIVSINGMKTGRWDELVKVIYASPGKEVKLEVLRGGEVSEIKVVPKEEKTTDLFGRDHVIGLIGMMPTSEFLKEKLNPLEAAWRGTVHTVELTGTMYKGIWLLITGQVSAKNLAGPIGIIDLTSQSAKQGFLPLMTFLAIISLNLAVLNFMPIPILDGGHLLFLMVEKVKGSPMSVKAQDKMQKVGLALLLALVVFATYNDILRFFHRS